jgi:hypothetical protein
MNNALAHKSYHNISLARPLAFGLTNQAPTLVAQDH